MVEGDAIFFARLLQRAQTLEVGFETGDLLHQRFQVAGLFVERALLLGKQRGQLTHFAFHRERTRAGLLAAGYGVAVVTDSVGEEKVKVRIANGQTLRGGAVFGQEAERDARQQVCGTIAESVGELQGIAQAAGDAGFGTDGGLGQGRGFVSVGFGMNQERGTAIEIGADEIEAALGVLPGIDHDVFQLFVEELFGGLFELRIDLDVIGQHAQRVDARGLAFFDGGEEALHGFRCIGAVRQHLLERFFARPNARDLGLERVDFTAQFGGGAAPLDQIFFGAAALAGYGFELQLALGERFGKLHARGFNACDLRRGDLLFTGGARGFPVDAGEIFVDLRQLILERGRLAKEAQNHLAAGLDGLLALTDLRLEGFTLLRDFRHAAARLRDLGVERSHRLLLRHDFAF